MSNAAAFTPTRQRRRGPLHLAALFVVIATGTGCPPRPAPVKSGSGAVGSGSTSGAVGATAGTGQAVPYGGGGATRRPLPPVHGRLVLQQTPFRDIGAVFVVDRAAANRNWLVRWSNDEVYVHHADSGHLIHRVGVGRTILRAALDPSGQRLCVLAEQPRAPGSRRQASLRAIALPASTGAYRTLWRKGSLAIGAHSALLATSTVCAVGLPASGSSSSQLRYHAYSWSSGAATLTSAPMRWFHRQPSALTFGASGRTLLAVFSSRGALRKTSRFMVDVLDTATLAVRTHFVVDCAALGSDGALHIAGGGLDRRHFGWIKKKTGLVVVGGGCAASAGLGSGAKELAFGAEVHRVLVARGKTLELRAVAAGGSARVVRVLARRTAAAGLPPDGIATHLAAGHLALADASSLYVWDLREPAPRRVGPLPAAAASAPHGPLRFFDRAPKRPAAAALAMLVAPSRRRRRLLRIEGGRVTWRASLSTNDRHRSKPGDPRWIFRHARYTPRPADVRWFGTSGGSGAGLVGVNPLGGAAVYPGASRKAKAQCCKRPPGTGGVFGLAVSPDQSSVALLITGARGGLEVRSLPDLRRTAGPFKLRHRRNDYARVRWLGAKRLALIRDARFISAPPTVTIYDLGRGGPVGGDLTFVDRGPVFWSGSTGVFYQLLDAGAGVRVRRSDGRDVGVVGLRGGAPFIMRASSRYSCSGAACAAFRCTREGRSQPPSACTAADRRGLSTFDGH